jgi:hypothetical protein
VRSISVPTHKLLVPMTYALGIGGVNELTGSVDYRHTCCEFTIRNPSNTLHHHHPGGVLGVQLPWVHQLATCKMHWLVATEWQPSQDSGHFCLPWSPGVLQPS